jgi:cation diffusion facilitator family transporter
MNIYMKDIDYRQGEKITVWCIVGNVVLTIFKLLAGIFGNSKAMVADALHSASDIVATSAVLIGIKVAKKPVDKKHPYGHGKAEPIVASFVGITLVFAAVLIVKGIVESMIAHTFATPTYLALAAAITSIAVKEVMFRVTYAAGRKINSESIMADAWHHRSDAYSSIGTLVGISGSIVGKALGVPFLEYLDPIAGAAVACFIFKIAFDILRRSMKNLMDSSPDDDKIKMIRDSVSDIEGILSIPVIKGRYIGQRLFIDMEIEVDSQNTVGGGHDIADETRQKVIERIDDVCEVLVHVEPQRVPEPPYAPPEGRAAGMGE